MFKFLKDSVRELKHVVWPTREETKNYFITVVVILVLFGIYLFIASTVFTKGLFGLKDLVNGKTEIAKSVEDVKTNLDLKSLKIDAKPTIKINTEKTEELNKVNSTDAKSMNAETKEVKEEVIVKETTGTGVSK